MNCHEVSGMLVAYLEGEVTPSERAAIQAHLAGCDPCNWELSAFSDLRGRVRESLHSIAARSASSPQAWERLKVSLSSKFDSKEQKWQYFGEKLVRIHRRWMMPFNWRVPRWLPVSAMVLLVVLAAYALVPPLRTAAQDPLGIFRVKRFATVTIDPASIPTTASKGDPTSLGSFTVNQMPSTTTVASIKEAQDAVGFGLRTPKKVPSGLEMTSKVTVSKEGSFSYTFDLKKAREYLATLGIAAKDLPANLDGATVKLTIPSQVVIEYRAPSGTGSALMLSQGHSPVLEAPPGLDVDLLRRQILSMPGLPAELTSQLGAIQDWRQTAVIPLPKEGFTSKEVSVDGGMKGLSIQGKAGDGNGLLWEKSGIIYGVGGSVTPEQLTDAANSMSP